MPFGKVQDQRNITVMSSTIPKKDSMPVLLLLAENILTVWYFWIKDIHRTAPNMERVDLMTRKDSPMKDIIGINVGGRRHMVVHVCNVVSSEGKNSRVYP